MAAFGNIVTPSEIPELDPRFPAPVYYQGQYYPSAENAAHASRFKDAPSRARIARVTAGQAAYKTAIAKNALPISDADLYGVMRAKFSEPDMAAVLKSTGGTRIILTNRRHDNVWGSCTCTQCRGAGDNILGPILEQVRSEIS